MPTNAIKFPQGMNNFSETEKRKMLMPDDFKGHTSRIFQIFLYHKRKTDVATSNHFFFLFILTKASASKALLCHSISVSRSCPTILTQLYYPQWNVSVGKWKAASAEDIHQLCASKQIFSTEVSFHMVVAHKRALTHDRTFSKVFKSTGLQGHKCHKHLLKSNTIYGCNGSKVKFLSPPKLKWVKSQ